MLKLVVFLVTVSVAFAAVVIHPAEVKPHDLACQEGCYFSRFKRVLSTKAYFYPNTECSRYLCLPNHTIRQETCGAVEVDDCCRLSAVDNSKRYPACCATEVCDDDEAPTTTTRTTTQAPTTTTPPPCNSYAYAYAAASAGGGQPPRSSANAYAEATAN